MMEKWNDGVMGKGIDHGWWRGAQRREIGIWIEQPQRKDSAGH